MKKSIFLILTYFFYSGTAQCTLDFANQDATLIIDELSQVTVSQLKLTNASQVTGWTQDSIIKSFVKSAASWTETYTAGVELGTGRRQPSTNMVVNNSNAINFLVPTMNLNKNNSNTIASIAPLAQANSNLIAALARLELSNSNTIVTLPVRVRSNSNALLRLIRSDSNAIISLNFRVRANSNAAVALSRRVVNNSNAINSLASASTTLIRNNSNAIVFVRNQIAPLNIQNSNAINFIGNTVQIVSNHSRFQATTTINKLILYKAGISVDAGKTLTLMTPLPVSGNIALKSTGKLVLAGDLYLNSNAYITSGGYVAGNNFSLVMSDSLVLSTLTTLQITSSLVIDGNGGTIVFGPHAQLLLESNVSLTLKNVNIQTTRNSSNIPIIRCFDQKGHVTFDNVTLACADDFPFRTGRLFFNNDVHFTGTSRFIYQSVMQSYVAPQSLLTFDPGTTLYYYPSSTTQDLIQLTDKSSGIYLKGSGTTLQTTFTGVRLTKGRLWMDNKVSLNTGPTTAFSSLTQTFSIKLSGSNSSAAEWSPDGRFLAAFNWISSTLRVFSVNSSGVLTLVASYNVPNSNNLITGVSWHPSGRFIAIGDAVTVGTAYQATVLSFNGSSLSLLSGVGFGTVLIGSVAWSPCGCYLACTGEATSTTTRNLNIYSFNNFTLSQSPVATASVSQTYPGFGGNFGKIAWSPNGNYITMSFITTTNTIAQHNTYLFNGTSLTLQSSATTTFGAGNTFLFDGWASWRPDGLFFAVSNETLNVAGDTAISIYSFTGQTQNLITNYNIVFANTGAAYATTWSPDGRYLACAGSDSSVVGIRIFEFNGTSLALRYTNNTTASFLPSYISWSSDGTKIAVGFQGSNNFVINYQVNYTSESNPQALTKGINFGNSTLGSTSDLDVYLLAGARVELNGKLFYNNVS